MNGWTILLVILLILVLLSLIRIGAEVSYGETGLGVRIRLGKFMLTILPKKEKPKGQGEKEKDPKADKKKKEKTKEPAKQQKTPSNQPKKTEGAEQPALPEGEAGKTGDEPSEPAKSEGEEKKPEEKKNKGGLPIPLMDLISIAIDAVGQVLSHLQIDVLHVEYTIGGKTDPAGAAIQYGMLYAGGGAIVPVLENTFYCVKKREIHAAIDFESDTSLIYLCLGLSIRIGQVFAIVGHLGWAFLKSFIKKQRTNKQEGKKNGTEASDQ